MNELVDAINGVQNGDQISVSVPLIDGQPLVVEGKAEVDSSGNVTIHANDTSIPGVPVVGEIDVSDIVLTIQRGDGINPGDTINATISAEASKGILKIGIDNANLSVDLENNTLSVSNAPVIHYGFGKIDLNNTYDISGGDSAFTIHNASASERETNKEQGELFTTVQTLETMMEDARNFDNSPSAVDTGDGFTGFNPTKAQNDISRFVTQATGAGAYLCYGYIYLFKRLENNWCSENAFGFGTIVSGVITKAFNEYKSCINNVYNGAVDAYNKVASVNGLPAAPADNSTISSLESCMDYFSSMKLKAQNDAGDIGMNIQDVIDAKNLFKVSADEGANRLEQLSNGISLYDDDNAQQEAFKTTVKALADKFITINSSIVSTIQDMIDEETLKLKSAAQSAASAMQG